MLSVSLSLTLWDPGSWCLVGEEKEEEELRLSEEEGHITHLKGS